MFHRHKRNIYFKVVITTDDVTSLSWGQCLAAAGQPVGWGKSLEASHLQQSTVMQYPVLFCHNIEDNTELRTSLDFSEDNIEESMSSSEDSDSDADAEARRSPDSTVLIRHSSEDEGQTRPGGSRSRLSSSSRSISSLRSSLSRSASPETSTRMLFIDSDEDGNDDEVDSTPQNQNKALEVRVDNSSDEEIERRDEDNDDSVSHGNDFDLMMAQKKEENRRHRRKKDIEVINDNDDAIAKLIAEMRIAAKEDRDLNDRGRPAIKKIGMLRHVMHNLTKVLIRNIYIYKTYTRRNEPFHPRLSYSWHSSRPTSCQ